MAVNTSLTQGLATKANQSALDALQVEVDGKSTPASVDLKLANHPTTAAMNSSIASANNATLATVAATYALKSAVGQLALDVAARQTAADVSQAIATALLPMASTSDLTAAVALRTTPADVSQLIATALLPYVQQTALDAALALQDGRLDAAEAQPCRPPVTRRAGTSPPRCSGTSPRAPTMQARPSRTRGWTPPTPPSWRCRMPGPTPRAGT